MNIGSLFQIFGAQTGKDPLQQNLCIFIWGKQLWEVSRGQIIQSLKDKHQDFKMYLEIYKKPVEFYKNWVDILTAGSISQESCSCILD